MVAADLSIPGHPDAYAVGDLADIDDGHGGRLPQLAQVAIQGGTHAAEQILATIARPAAHAVPLPRQGHDGHHRPAGRGGRAARWASTSPVRLAWFAWLGLHLVYLIGVRNRVSVFVNWAWNYLTWDRGPRLILRPEVLPHTPHPISDGSLPTGAPGRAGAWRRVGAPSSDQHRGISWPPPPSRSTPPSTATSRPSAPGDKDGYLARVRARRPPWRTRWAATWPPAPSEIAGFWDGVRGLTPSITLVKTGAPRIAAGEAAWSLRAIAELGDTKMAVDIIDVMAFDDDGRSHVPAGLLGHGRDGALRLMALRSASLPTGAFGIRVSPA